MSLNLYRRHRANCKAGHPDRLCSGEFDERRKGWKKCDCFIHASGTLQGKFSRKSTGQIDWEKAKETTSRWTSWEETGGDRPARASSSQTKQEPDSDPQSDRVTIQAAVDHYRTELKIAHALSTQRGTSYLLDKVMTFSLAMGYVYLDQWKTVDVRAFYASWQVASSTARKDKSRLMAFLNYAVQNEWLTQNPAATIRRKVRTRKEREEDNAPRIPFTDRELERMYDVCERLYGTKGLYKRVWTGQDLADFIALSVWTGLRISDVATFDIARLDASGNCRLRTTKTGTAVATWIPPWLAERLRTRAAKHGPLIFGTHQTEDLAAITDVWRRKLLKVWKLAGPWSQPPMHHRFRHTFARILLQKGISVPMVADLLGDTEAMVRKHYAQWVPERQEHLRAALIEAFADKPRPQVIAFPSKAV